MRPPYCLTLVIATPGEKCYGVAMTRHLITVKADADQTWVNGVLRDCWGGPMIALRGQCIDAARLPALIGWIDNSRCGLATFQIDRGVIELITLNSLESKLGLGTQLLEAVCVAGRKAGCKRAVLVTTNDNLDALGFYQRRGWQLSGLMIGGADIARRLKPSIPMKADNGIPIRDEIELSLHLSGWG